MSHHDFRHIPQTFYLPLPMEAGEASLAGEELLHHAVLDGAGLVAASFQCGDLGVHIGEDGGDGCLLLDRRQRHLDTRHVRTIGRVHFRPSCEPLEMVSKRRPELQVGLEAVCEYRLVESCGDRV